VAERPGTNVNDLSKNICQQILVKMRK
jgi:hypothetical protein